MTSYPLWALLSISRIKICAHEQSSTCASTNPLSRNGTVLLHKVYLSKNIVKFQSVGSLSTSALPLWTNLSILSHGLDTLQVLTDSYRARMAQKLGLKSHDDELLNGFMRNMYEDDADFTNTFRALRSVPSQEEPVGECGRRKKPTIELG